MSELTAERDWSTAYLLARLELVRAQVESVVLARRRVDPKPDDPYRGVYTDESEVDQLLRPGGRLARRPPPDAGMDAARAALSDKSAGLRQAGTRLRLDEMAVAFGLDPFDVDLLMVGMAPDLDPSFEKLYGYLNDDVTRRRASVGLAIELCGAAVTDGWARSRLASSAPLIAGGLASVEDGDRPVLGRSLRVPDRVVDHLLGRDEPDPAVAPLLVRPGEWPGRRELTVERAVRSGVTLFYAQENSGSAALSYFAAGLERAGKNVVAIDLTLQSGTDDMGRLAAAAAREARLCGAALVVAHVEALAERGASEPRRWAEAPGLIVLTGSQPWDPRWCRRPPLLVEVPPLADVERVDSWARALGDGALGPGARLSRTVGAYRLTPEQVRQAAEGARLRAEARGAPVEPEDIQAGARAQNAAGLEKLARRIAPRATWEDMVLPRMVESQLRSIAGRVRQRGQVYDEWRLASSSAKGRGVTSLFAGDSGTGKTMSAEVVAKSLGLDLYVIDLSTVVDKYIGETEKNLDRIFLEAERVNGVLLFDEADAIFGKRSEVKDARDRYANVEVAYLLQRMEQFDGLAILTTNLRANVDEAFLRRIDVLVDFPVPDVPSRCRLWSKQLTPETPVADDIDLDFLASAFELSGGNIRNVVLSAAFEAAEDEVAVSMSHLIRATSGEYRKLGRLCVEAEFGRYFSELQR
ncbi:MAG TPA: AAA family ATPase [Acidimicrobiales bacterium]|nr:AAA family ATPase [Acidimicrobiales bacterium]